MVSIGIPVSFFQGHGREGAHRAAVGGATLRYAGSNDTDLGRDIDFGTTEVTDDDNVELAVIADMIGGIANDREQVRRRIPAAAPGETVRREFRLVHRLRRGEWTLGRPSRGIIFRYPSQCHPAETLDSRRWSTQWNSQGRTR